MFIPPGYQNSAYFHKRNMPLLFGCFALPKNVGGPDGPRYTEEQGVAIQKVARAFLLSILGVPVESMTLQAGARKIGGSDTPAKGSIIVPQYYLNSDFDLLNSLSANHHDEQASAILLKYMLILAVPVAANRQFGMPDTVNGADKDMELIKNALSRYCRLDEEISQKITEEAINTDKRILQSLGPNRHWQLADRFVRERFFAQFQAGQLFYGENIDSFQSVVHIYQKNWRNLKIYPAYGGRFSTSLQNTL